MLSVLRQLIVVFLLLFMFLVDLLSYALLIGGVIYLLYLIFFASNRSWELFGYAFGAILFAPFLSPLVNIFPTLLLFILHRDDQEP